MKRHLAPLLALVLLPGMAYGGVLDFLFGKKDTNQPSGILTVPLTQEQIVQGLKEALNKGVQTAVSQLGQPNGFLSNLNVRIPMPEQLQTVERTLRTLRQNQLADEFVATMNHAAEQAVPVAVGVFTDAIRSMSLQDAQSILLGSNTAATAYFRKATSSNLFAQFLPIVKKTTDQTGVTSAYKRLVDTAGANLGPFARSMLGLDSFDLDSYVTNKGLDGLFKMVAEEEIRIRQNPVARTSELLQKVFGSVTHSLQK